MPKCQIVAVVLALAVLAVGSPAFAVLNTCVNVVAPQKFEEGLRRLVESEIDRHPAQHRVTEGCSGTLTVELIVIGSETALTARLDGEVPYRTAVQSGKLVSAVERALRIVLHNDPRTLKGPQRSNWFGQRLEEFRIVGRNYFGLELAQTFALVDGRVQSLAGAALTAHREVGGFYLGARAAAASSFPDKITELALTEQILAQLQLGVYSNGSLSHAWFVAATAGFELQRFQGISPWASESSATSALAKGLSVGMVGGIEMLRWHDMRARFFVQLLLPTFVSRDIDRGVVDQWTPTAALGIGVAF